MDFKLAVFPYKAKFYGVIAILIGVILAYFYFKGNRPDFLVVPVFAIVSSYLETRYLVVAQTNLLDELATILFIIGMVAVSFSERKNEKEEYNSLRIKALFYSIFVTLSLWILLFLFIYGMAVFIVSSFIFIIYLVSYNLLFVLFAYKTKIKKTHT